MFFFGCKCHHEFCYLCGLTWKTCACVQWDEGRLLQAAEHRVQRQVQGNPYLNQNLAVAQEAARLRRDHNCDHRRFDRVDGAHRCELCRENLADFILECWECDLQICVRCRQNRL